MDNKRKRILFYKYLVLAVQVFIMIWLCAIKPAVNEDEVWTYFISNNFVVNQHLGVSALNNWSNISAIDNIMWIAPGHRFDYSFILNYAAFDVHPPLYNILLHTICSVFYRLGFSFWYGYGLNIFIAVLNYLVIWKTSKILFKSDQVSLLLGIIYSFSIGTYNNICFIRFYILASFFVINALYLHLKLYYTNEKKNYIFILINTLLGMLTFYPFGVYQFFLSAVNFLVFIIQKDFKKLKNYLGAIVASGILFLAIFPNSVYQVLYGTPGSGFRDMNRTYMTDFFLFLKIISKEVFGNCIGIVLVALFGFIVICLYKKIKFNMQKMILPILYIPIIGYLLIMAHMAPFNTTGRYHSIIYPVIIVAVYGGLACLIQKVMESEANKNRDKTVITFFTMSFILIPVIVFYIRSNLLYNIEYLMYGVKEYNKIAQQFEGTDCVCIFDGNPLKLYINYGELKTFDNIYFTNEELLLTSEDEKLKDNKSLILYITQGLDRNKIIDKLLSENENLSLVEDVYQWRYADVVYLKGTE